MLQIVNGALHTQWLLLIRPTTAWSGISYSFFSKAITTLFTLFNWIGACTFKKKNLMSNPNFLLLKCIFIITACVFTSNFSLAQGYISPFKYEDGKQVLRSRSEILLEESERNKNRKPLPQEYDKQKNGANSSGEIWIDGFCRYRPPASNKSRYNDNVSEISYCKEIYPTDVIIQSDDFKGGGSIPWLENTYIAEREKCEALLQRLPAAVNDGLPFPKFDSLVRLSSYSKATGNGYKKGRDYEFSRAVSFRIKRISGSEKSYVSLNTRYPFTNGEDYTYMEVNDKGQFTVRRFCFNCKSPQSKELESGKSKAWKSGDWNEITVMKDQYNTVTVYINGDEICRYQISAIPITVRFASFHLSMPAKWEKENLMYHIGSVTSISYPKVK